MPLTVCILGALTAAALLSLPGPDRLDDTATPAGSSAETPNAAAGGANDEPRINIADFTFESGISVQAGETLTVTNSDGVAHTLTSNDGLFDTGDLGGGATGSVIAPEVAGTYSFICLIHPSMTGSVTVTP